MANLDSLGSRKANPTGRPHQSDGSGSMKRRRGRKRGHHWMKQKVRKAAFQRDKVDTGDSGIDSGSDPGPRTFVPPGQHEKHHASRMVSGPPSPHPLVNDVIKMRK